MAKKLDLTTYGSMVPLTTFEDTEQVLRRRLGNDLIDPIEVSLKGTLWAQKDDPHLDITSCPTAIYRSLSTLADNIPRAKLSNVTRVAAERGCKILWMLPWVGELAEIHRQLVELAPNEVNVLCWFERASFDLGTNDTGRLHGRIYQDDKEMLYKLADSVGLRYKPSTVMVLALAAGVLGSQKIPAQYNNEFAELLARFGQWIRERLALAKRLESAIPNKSTPDEERFSLVDVFEELYR